MLKKGLRLVVCLVMLGMLLSGCHLLYPNGWETPTTTTEPPTITTETPLPEEAPTPDSEGSLPDWKQAYLERIESDGAQTARQMYALVYVDGDDIPELYIQGFDMATGDSVCSYKNGTFIEQNMLRCWGGSYIEKSGCFANRNGSTGTHYVEVFRLDDSGFTETFCAHYGEHYRYEGDVTDEEYYERVCTFYIEDEEVSEEDYRAAVAAAFDFGRSVEFYDLAVSYEDIRYQILGYDDSIVKDSPTDPISSAVG